MCTHYFMKSLENIKNLNFEFVNLVWFQTSGGAATRQNDGLGFDALLRRRALHHRGPVVDRLRNLHDGHDQRKTLLSTGKTKQYSIFCYKKAKKQRRCSLCCIFSSKVGQVTGLLGFLINVIKDITGVNRKCFLYVHLRLIIHLSFLNLFFSETLLEIVTPTTWPRWTPSRAGKRRGRRARRPRSTSAMRKDSTCPPWEPHGKIFVTGKQVFDFEVIKHLVLNHQSYLEK